MRFVVAACFALFALGAFAQQMHPFAFEPGTPLQGPVAFRFVRVVDNRAVKSDLGFIRVGSFNQPERLSGDAFEPALQAYCNSLLPQAGSGPDTLLFVLYDFSLEDRPNSEALGTFYLRGRFYLGGNDRYRFLRPVDSFYEIRSKGDFTRTVLRLPSACLHDCLDGLKNERPLPEEPPLHQAEAVASLQTEKARFPVYGAARFPRGVYWHYNDFLQLQAADTGVLQADHYSRHGNRPMFYCRNERGKRAQEIDGAFAIYTGEDWYYPALGGWKQMAYEGGDFFKTAQFEGLQTLDRGVVVGAAAVLFGIPGAVLAAVSTGGTGALSSGWYRARLDPATGRLMPVQRLN